MAEQVSRLTPLLQLPLSSWLPAPGTLVCGCPDLSLVAPSYDLPSQVSLSKLPSFPL